MVEAKNKLCPVCKREMTDEEVEMKANSCWFCLANMLQKLDELESLPDPETYGRPGATVELARQEQLESLKKVKAGGTPTATAPELKLTEEERKEVLLKFGFDPMAKTPVTIVTVKGQNDDTFMQYSFRGTVSPEMKKEFERYMKFMLETFGTIQAFGPNLASTIINMKMLPPEMLLKNS